MKTKTNRGFLVVEMLVAVAIITFSILAAMAVTQKALYVARLALHESEAALLLEEGAEATRILRDNDWDNVSSLSNGTNYYPTFAGGTWTLSTTPATVGIFTRTVNLASVNRDSTTLDISESGADDPKTKLITVTVSWSEGDATKTKTLSFYLLDIFS